MLRQSIWLLSAMLLMQSVARATQEYALNDFYLENIIKNMDFSKDACEDFYSFSCGNWVQNYNLSAEYLDVPGYMDYMVNKQLLEVLQQNHAKSIIYQKLWSYYDSCMKLKNPALNYYLRLVEPELNFTWPIFRANWSKSWDDGGDFNWLTTIARLRWYGLNGVFITQNTNVRPKNGSHYILEINQPEKGITLQAKEIAEIFVNFGMTTNESEIVTTKIMELERKMLQLTMLEVQLQDANSSSYLELFSELTIEQLHEKINFIDWQQYFEIILGRKLNATLEFVQLFYLNLDYFQQLRVALARTSNETIAYYIMLKFMYTLNDALPIVMEDNSQKCIGNLRGHMSLAMNYLYEIHIYRPLRAKYDKRIWEMYGKLRQHLQQQIAVENRLQLNATMRDFLLEELHSMQLKIGNVPNTTELEQFVTAYYENLLTNSTDFYVNHLRMLRFNHKTQLKQLENKVAPNELQFFEVDVKNSASSSPTKVFQNAILIPYGYLQLPLFHSDVSPLLQYSLFGFILAHEIVHAFDLFHIVYDKAGNYDELGWHVAQLYHPHLDCLAAGVNASENMSENVADVAGLHLAYRTYFGDVVNSLRGEFETFKTNLTMQQLFFVNSVQFLCGNTAKISKINIEKLNLEHDIHDMRVRQNWAVFDEFAKAFNCKKGTQMNTRKHCQLW